MIDDASVQRGIEGYLPKRAAKYPAYFLPHVEVQNHLTEKEREEAVKHGLDPATVPPVTKTLDYVHIDIPGGDSYEGPAEERHKQAYPSEWAAYKRGEEYSEGLPLAEWATMPKEMRQRCQMLNIFTVEQFIGMDGPTLQKVGPEVTRFQLEAQRFLGKSRSVKRDEEKEALENRIAELERKLESSGEGGSKKGKSKEIG